MTVFRFTESRDSRSGTYSPPSETRTYTAAGSSDASVVRVYAVGATPAFVSHEQGTLYRQDVEITATGFEQWRVTVPYGPRTRAQDEWTLDFDTTGGTVHITNSKETVNKYTAPNKPAAEDMGGAIGVRGDQIDGTDIVIPALKLTVSYKHPSGVITIAQIKNLARYTGKYNTKTFLTFAEGEVLFLGASGREGTDVETDIKYTFAASENLIQQTIGTVVNVEKKGWEHAWIRYEDAAVNGVPVKRPQWVYVERVYDGIDLGQALGFGD